MNVMLLYPTGDIFLGFIHTTRNKDMKACIAMELKKFIDEIGPSFVTQICMDNAMNMFLAIDDIVTTYLHVFKQNCAGQTLDLMLDDWTEIDQFKDLIMRTKHVCLYMLNHHLISVPFQKNSLRKSLIVLADTQFACQFFMISQMIEIKNALK